MDHFREPIKTDCEELLTRFHSTASVRYVQFVEIWREMNFSSIFYGKPDPIERRRFARLVMSVASPYLFPPYTFQIRVGGLYLLYGLFNLQLVTPREKIRIALKDWKDVVQFQRDALNAQHYDVVYIFRKLQSDKAFYFTAMPTPLYFRQKRDVKKREICKEFFDPSSRPQELMSTNVLEEIANVHEHYEGLKKTVFAEPDPNVNLIQQNLVPKLNGAVLAYSNWQWNRAEFEEQDPGEGPSNQESSRRAQLLASIKSRSYGQVMEASKSRRHRQTQLAPAAEAGSSQNVWPKKKPSQSLKARTQLRFNTQGNESEGLKITRVWNMSSVKEEKAPEKKKRKFNWNPEKSSDPS